MSRVVLQGYILVPVNELDIVNRALVDHCRFTLEEPGCLTFNVIQNENDPSRFDVYEAFVDQAAFEHHQRRVASSEWGRLTRNVKRHYEITHAQ